MNKYLISGKDNYVHISKNKEYNEKSIFGKRLYNSNNDLKQRLKEYPDKRVVEIIRISSTELKSVDFDILFEGYDNLKILYLDHNTITNLNIKKRHTLEILYINNNKLESFEFIKYFPALRILDANNNEIKSIPETTNNTLTLLRLSHNDITNMDNIAQFTSLEQLDISYNNINTVNNLPKRIKTLYINNNPRPVYDTGSESPISSGYLTFSEELPVMPFLNTLYAGSTNLKNLNFIRNKKIPSLKVLNLSANNIIDISALSGLNTIEELDLSHNWIENVKALDGFKKLKNLQLNVNSIDDIMSFGTLSNLEVLNLNSNKINGHIPDFKNLISLDLSNNPINKIRNLGVMPRLKYLTLRENRLENLNGLEKLPNLIELDISNNRINDISLLKPIYKLLFNEYCTLKLNGNYFLDNKSLDNASDEKIVEYCKEQFEPTNTFDAKIILVGASGAGKTSFVRRLKDGIKASLPHCDNRTYFMEIEKKKVLCEPNSPNPFLISYSVLDFGGEERFSELAFTFYTDNTLFIYIDDPRNNNDHLKQWLFKMKTKIEKEDFQNVKVLIIQNERYDDYCFKGIDMQALKKDYDFLLGLKTTNLYHEDSIKYIRQDIDRILYHEYESSRQYLIPRPKHWEIVEKEIKKLRTKENSKGEKSFCCSIGDIENIIRNQGISDTCEDNENVATYIEYARTTGLLFEIHGDIDSGNVIINIDRLVNLTKDIFKTGFFLHSKNDIGYERQQASKLYTNLNICKKLKLKDNKRLYITSVLHSCDSEKYFSEFKKKNGIKYTTCHKQKDYNPEKFMTTVFNEFEKYIKYAWDGVFIIHVSENEEYLIEYPVKEEDDIMTFWYTVSNLSLMKELQKTIAEYFFNVKS